MSVVLKLCRARPENKSSQVQVRADRRVIEWVEEAGTRAKWLDRMETSRLRAY